MAMTTTFDSSQHPRGHASNAGAFNDKPQSTPDIALGQFLSIAPGDTEYLTMSGDGPIECLSVHRSEDGGTFTIESAQMLRFSDYSPAGANAAGWVDKNLPVIRDFLATRYNAELDDSGSEGTEFWVRFTTERTGTLTESEAFNSAWNESAAVQLYNEADHGTFGALNFGRLLGEHIDNHAVSSAATWAAADVSDRAIDSEVDLRSGEREIRDVTALAIAARFDRELYPALGKLATHGFANRQALNSDLGKLYVSEIRPIEKRRVDMMFTWAIHGGDNS